MSGSAWLDVALFALAAAAAISGWMNGAAASAFALLGVGIGATSGLLVAPHLVREVDSPVTRLLAGLAMLTETVRRARDAGAHVLIAAMEAGNTASLRLHESVGFEPVGTFAEVGYKFGRWLDLTQLRLPLGPPGPPAPRH